MSNIVLFKNHENFLPFFDTKKGDSINVSFLSDEKTSYYKMHNYESDNITLYGKTYYYYRAYASTYNRIMTTELYETDGTYENVTIYSETTLFDGYVVPLSTNATITSYSEYNNRYIDVTFNSIDFINNCHHNLEQDHDNFYHYNNKFDGWFESSVLYDTVGIYENQTITYPVYNYDSEEGIITTPVTVNNATINVAVNEEGYSEPHLSYCRDDESVHYNLFFSANDEYTTELLRQLHNLGLVASKDYMTEAEAKYLGAVYVDTDEISTVGYHELVANYEDYVWFRPHVYYFTAYHMVWDSATYLGKCRFGMDITKFNGDYRDRN